MEIRVSVKSMNFVRNELDGGKKTQAKKNGIKKKAYGGGRMLLSMQNT